MSQEQGARKLKKWHWWVIGIGAVLVIGGTASALGAGGTPDAGVTPSTTPTVNVTSVTVPDVKGTPGDVARKTLTDAGFTVKFDGGDETVIIASSWTVDAQEPTAGASAAKGSEVTLHVSRVKATPSPESKTTKGLTATPALAACGRAGDDNYPYGFRYHITDLSERIVADKWVVSGQATIKNAYGAKRTVAFLCRVSGTDKAPTVEYFSAGD